MKQLTAFLILLSFCFNHFNLIETFCDADNVIMSLYNDKASQETTPEEGELEEVETEIEALVKHGSFFSVSNRYLLNIESSYRYNNALHTQPYLQKMVKPPRVLA